MTKKHFVSFIASVLLVVASAFMATATEPSRSVEMALQEADAGRKTPEGQAYEMAFAEKFTPTYLKQALKCTPGDETVTVAIKLSADGGVVDVLTTTSTPGADCIRRAIRKGSFPKPPKPGHWVRIVIQAAVNHK